MPNGDNLMCPNCKGVDFRHELCEESLRMKHDGRLHTVAVSDVPVAICKNCSTEIVDVRADRIARQALRTSLGLYQAAEIRNQREALGLTQEQLGERIGVASETISRWENERVIQSISHDKLLRIFFKLPVWFGHTAALVATDAPVTDQWDTSIVATTYDTCAPVPCEAANKQYGLAA